MDFEQFIQQYKQSGKRDLFSQLINDILEDKEFPKGKNNECVFSYIRFRISIADGNFRALEKMVEAFSKETGVKIETMPLSTYINAIYNFETTENDLKSLLQPFVTKKDVYDQLPQEVLVTYLEYIATKSGRHELLKEIHDGYKRILSSD